MHEGLCATDRRRQMPDPGRFALRAEGSRIPPLPGPEPDEEPETSKKALGGAVRVEFEKPLTRTEVAGGPCLPDFLITVTRPNAYSHLPEGPGHPKHHGRFNPRDRARYVVEVMGFDDEDYERDKKETHPRMERIGRLFCMEGHKFDSAGNPLRRQRETITADIEEDLLERWTASEST